MLKEWNPPVRDLHDHQLVGRIANYLTLPIEEVADWHYTDAVLDRDWDKPLVSLLRFLVEDSLPTECVDLRSDCADLDPATELPVAA